MGARILKVAGSATLIAVLVYCLFDYALQQYGPLRNFVGGLGLIFQPQIQWGVFTLACLWCIGLILLAFVWSDLWLLGFLLIAVLAYATNYDTAASEVAAVNILLAVAIGKSVALLQARKLIIPCLVALLTGTACLHLDFAGSYYHEDPRWMGLWYDPNVYGILMGVGSLLALGLSLSRPGRPAFKLVFLASASVLAFGLLKSYSRGAWCGSVIGLIYLIKGLPRGRRNSVVCVLGILLVAVLSCNIFGAKSHLMGRVLSVTNTYDLSWRNRLTTWRDSLQMMAEHPWRGVGWGMSVETYQYWYTPPRLTAGALCTNSYAMIGIELGLPALVCFVAYGWSTLTCKPIKKHQETEQVIDLGLTTSDWLGTICRAGAIVLAVGFIFDGKLFDLSLASCFWILLESGKSGTPGGSVGIFRVEVASKGSNTSKFTAGDT